MDRCNVIDYLSRTLKSPEQCVVYFYFDHNEQVNQTAEFVLRCLLKQLVFQLSGSTELLPHPLRAAFDKYTSEGCKITPNVFDFAEIFVECAKICRRPVYVILDAYNEYYEENVINPLTLRLQQFVKSGFVKLYITSRVQLHEIQWPRQSMRLQVLVPDLDVSRLVRAKIEHKKYDPELEEDIVKAVTENANGL